MRNTKLILIEGLSGSGKSTMAGFLSRQLTKNGIAHTWWYEECKWHPLYTFHDQASLQQLIDTIQAGNYRQVVAAVLEKWRQFADALHKSDTVVILDSCLFGYLIWTLFPFDVPQAEIHAYLARVLEIISVTHPYLIYLRPDNVAVALKRFYERGGGETEQNAIEAIEQSSYAKRRGLQGFDGVITYWTDYRRIVDEVFASIDFAKLLVENSAGDWSTYQQQALDFLDLPLREEPISCEELERFVGVYSYREDGIKRTCQVRKENDYLVAEGVPQLWPQNRLVPIAPNVFAIESFPFEIRFTQDTNGNVGEMVLTGPEQLFGTVNATLLREEG